MVTRPDGQPAVEAGLIIRAAGKNGNPVDLATGMGLRVTTDDRGIYRVYGLNPGPYTVCVSPRSTSGFSGAVNCYGSDDINKPGVIELAGGTEVGNVDIPLGRLSPGYEASGQAVDEDGKPVAGAFYVYFGISDGGPFGGPSGHGTSDLTGQDGRFKILGLPPGRYIVRLLLQPDSNAVAEGAAFEVKDSDVSDVQVKVHRTASIEGIVTVEGNQAAQGLAQLPNAGIYTWSDGGTSTGGGIELNPEPNGAFHIDGLGAGHVYFTLRPSTGFALVRVEQNGVLSDGPTVSPGEQVTGINLVLTYGTAIIRGQVKGDFGSLPPDSNIVIEAQLIRSPDGMSKDACVDARGNFEIDGLPDGQYQISVRVPRGGGWRTEANQIITVTGGQSPNVSIILNPDK